MKNVFRCDGETKQEQKSAGGGDLINDFNGGHLDTHRASSEACGSQRIADKQQPISSRPLQLR